MTRHLHSLLLVVGSIFLAQCSGQLLLPIDPSSECSGAGCVCTATADCGAHSDCIAGHCEVVTCVQSPNGLCPAGRQCSDGVCVEIGQPAFCDCQPKQGCNAGVCVDINETTTCSSDNPTGLCGEGSVCQGGTCEPIASDPCLPEHLTGLCPEGSVCVSGYCEPITDYPCSAVHLDGRCVPGMHCVSPGVCDYLPCELMAGGRCDPGLYCASNQTCIAQGKCATTADCGAHYTCDGALCVRDQSCSVDTDCLISEHCSTTSVCMPVGSCAVTADCTDTQVCSTLDHCISAGTCESVGDCTAGDRCGSGKTCLAPGECSGSSDCPPGEGCTSGQCAPNGTLCSSNTTCGTGTGMRCSGGASCNVASDCGTGQQCTSHVCSGSCIFIGQCVTNNDCISGYQCNASYVCVPNQVCTYDSDCATANCSVNGGCIPAGKCAAKGDCSPAETCDASWVCVGAGNCGGSSFGATLVEPNMLIVLDGSGSMTENDIALSPPETGNETRWQAAKDAIASVLADNVGRVRFGLSMFPYNEGITNSCASGQINVAVNDGTQNQINNTLATTVPYGGTSSSTPTRVTLNTIAANTAGFGLADPTRGNYVLLVTDGEPNCETGCGRRDANCAPSRVNGAINALYNLTPSIKTFVIGLHIDPVSDSLNCDAVYGRTASPQCTASLGSCTTGSPPTCTCSGTSTAACYAPANDLKTLKDNFKAIAGQVLSCSYALASVPPDTGLLYVYAHDPASCSPPSSCLINQDAANGWTYDPATNQLNFHGSACTNVQSGAFTASVVYGCPAAGG